MNDSMLDDTFVVIEVSVKRGGLILKTVVT